MSSKMNKIPNREECFTLLKEYNTPEHVIRHCTAVCDVALLIANRLNQKGYNINIELLQACCLLHDIARVYDEHETVGSIYLSKIGYNNIAHIIIKHTKYKDFSRLTNINETDILCIADRTVLEDKFVGIPRRMEYIKQKAKRNGKEEFIPFIQNGEKMLTEYIESLENVMGITLKELVDNNGEA